MSSLRQTMSHPNAQVNLLGRFLEIVKVALPDGWHLVSSVGLSKQTLPNLIIVLLSFTDLSLPTPIPSVRSRWGAEEPADLVQVHPQRREERLGGQAVRHLRQEDQEEPGAPRQDRIVQGLISFKENARKAAATAATSTTADRYVGWIFIFDQLASGHCTCFIQRATPSSP